MRSTPADLANQVDEPTRPAARSTLALSRAADFIELVKPRLVLMILITTAAGFYIGSYPRSIGFNVCIPSSARA